MSRGEGLETAVVRDAERAEGGGIHCRPEASHTDTLEGSEGRLPLLTARAPSKQLRLSVPTKMCRKRGEKEGKD